jgi:hypothetical protein
LAKPLGALAYGGDAPGTRATLGPAPLALPAQGLAGAFEGRPFQRPPPFASARRRATSLQTKQNRPLLTVSCQSRAGIAFHSRESRPQSA